MKSLLTTLFVACSVVIASAQDADKERDVEQRVRKLEERMAMLEERMARTESRTVASQQTPDAAKMGKVAKLHMQEERKNYKPEDILQAEAMYVKASTVIREGGDPKVLLDSVVSMYPQLNRAGCAQLYRAQDESGQEKERLLTDCIARFSSCYYGDGTQVGPLAMLELADYYKQVGKEQDAQKLFKKLRKEYSESVGHDGSLLVDKIR